jgi:hypothetical protein
MSSSFSSATTTARIATSSAKRCADAEVFHPPLSFHSPICCVDCCMGRDLFTLISGHSIREIARDASCRRFRRILRASLLPPCCRRPPPRRDWSPRRIFRWRWRRPSPMRRSKLGRLATIHPRAGAGRRTADQGGRRCGRRGWRLRLTGQGRRLLAGGHRQGRRSIELMLPTRLAGMGSALGPFPTCVKALEKALPQPPPSRGAPVAATSGAGRSQLALSVP